jgi:hypothetical protein
MIAALLKKSKKLIRQLQLDAFSVLIILSAFGSELELAAASQNNICFLPALGRLRAS